MEILNEMQPLPDETELRGKIRLFSLIDSSEESKERNPGGHEANEERKPDMDIAHQEPYESSCVGSPGERNRLFSSTDLPEEPKQHSLEVNETNEKKENDGDGERRESDKYLQTGNRKRLFRPVGLSEEAEQHSPGVHEANEERENDGNGERRESDEYLQTDLIKREKPFVNVKKSIDFPIPLRNPHLNKRNVDSEMNGEKNDTPVAVKESLERRKIALINEESVISMDAVDGVKVTMEHEEQRLVKAVTEIAKIHTNETERNFELQLEEIIVKKYETSDGEKEKRFYRVAIFVGKNRFVATVDAEKIGESKWIKMASYGLAYYHRGKNAEYFDKYVSRILSKSNPPIRIVYSSNGWKKIEGRHVYVYDSGTIGNIFVNVSGDEKHLFEFDPGKIGSHKIFLQALGMLDICADKRVTLPLFLFTHIGVLTTLFDQAGCPIKFILAVIGETNSRKTSLTLCMTKIFNRRKIQEPEINFNSTEGGIEKCIGQHSDAVSVVDDLAPAITQSKQNQINAKAEKVIRMFGDRKGVERMTDFAKNPRAGYYPVRGVGIITGELFHNVKSSLSRCLIIDIDKGSVDNKTLAFYQQHYKILNTHIYDFVHFITEKHKDVIEFIENKVPEYRQNNRFNLPRYKEMYAVLMTGMEIFLIYAKTRQFLRDGEWNSMYENWENTIRAVIEKNENGLKRQDWTHIFAEVCAAIAENGTSPLPQQEVKNYGNEVFEDERHLYLRLDTFLEKLKKYMALWQMDGPELSKQEILNLMEKGGLIETMGKAEGKRSLRLPRAKINRQRFLYIKKDKVYSILR